MSNTVSAETLEGFEIKPKYPRSDGNILVRFNRHVGKYYRGDTALFSLKSPPAVLRLALYPFPKFGPGAEEINAKDIGARDHATPGRGDGVAWTRPAGKK